MERNARTPSGTVRSAEPLVPLDPEISAVASCAWVSLSDPSAGAAVVIRQFQHLSRALPPTIGWLVVRTNEAAVLTVHVATGLAVTARAFADRGPRLVIHTQPAPISPGVLTILGSVPIIRDDSEHVARLATLRASALDLHRGANGS